MNAQTLKPLIGPSLVLALLTVVALYARPLTPIDETRYASVAWEMWLRDEYLVLFKNGEPYSHKPPLLFWLYNLGWAIFGVNEWWPRLVSPLFSFAGLFLTFSIARRLWPGEADAGRNALWILGSSLLWLVFSTLAMFDVMLAFFVLLGMRGLLIAADESMWRGFVWLALAIGLGVLAKGPVILLHLLPAAVLAPWWRSNLTPDSMRWKQWYGGIILATLGGAAIALAWAIPAAIHGGESYRNAIFWGQTADRMVDSFAHKRPFWWYVPLLILLLFPWLMWPALWRRIAAIRHGGLDKGLRFCLAWAVPVFVSFSLISGKQPHYLVPLIPAFALFSGKLLVNRGARTGVGLPALLCVLLGGAMIYFAVAGVPPRWANWNGLPVWPGLTLVVLAVVLLWLSRDPSWQVASLAVTGAATLALLQIYVSTSIAPRYDVHPLAREIKRLQDHNVPVANAARYHAQYQFAGRLERPLEQLRQAEIVPWLDKHPHGVVVIYLKQKGKRTEAIPADAIFSQTYRGDIAMLLNAEQARRWLRSGDKAKTITTLPDDSDDPGS